MITVETAPTTSLTCPRDGAGTRLTCGRCGTPICPACLVRTEVGMRCPDCAGGTAPTSRRRSRLVARAVVVVVAGALLGATAVWWSGRSDGGAGEAVVADMEDQTLRIGDQVTVGRFAVTVVDFNCSPAAPSVAGTPAQRCEASLRVRNDSLAEQQFATSLQAVREGIRRFPARPVPPIRIAPGEVADVTLEFRLPQAIQPGRLELRPAAKQAAVWVSLQP